MTNRFLVPALALLLGASACGPPRQPGDSPDAQAEGATLVVQNQSWLDMNVYVLEGASAASRRRLGSVTGNSTGTLRIPGSAVGLGRPLRFVVDPVGSARTASSYEIQVRPGERVTITIPSTVGR
jgi:hypothetical protein